MRLTERIARSIIASADHRKDEYAFAWKHLRACKSILDVGSGTGTFLELAPERIHGVDINPDNVAYCTRKGLTAKVGSALQLPYDADTFDGVHCSHLLQVFDSADGVECLRELGRVVKPNGIIVITTLTDFRRFFRHPENVRPWPPDAIFRLQGQQRGAQSPMFPDLPSLKVGPIWRRHPALVELEFPSVYRLRRYLPVLNALQYRLGLRKWWTYHAYSLVLFKRSQPAIAGSTGA